MNQFNPYQMPQAYMYGQNLQKMEVIKVNGEEGAKAFSLAPNSSVLLLDETAPVVWLKTTDGASYPTLVGYSIKPLVEVKKQEQNDLLASLEARIAKLERMCSNGKSNTAATRQSD